MNQARKRIPIHQLNYLDLFVLVAIFVHYWYFDLMFGSVHIQQSQKLREERRAQETVS